jgi:hypothetical protein
MLHLVRDKDSIVKQTTNKNKCIKKEEFEGEEEFVPNIGESYALIRHTQLTLSPERTTANN